ncbi:MAG: hypothetical protein BGP25_05145 [Lysobacterales bacterium 63-13]|nr:MAG: hypothetical protein BGP25_05145 [Xanthomonadales bacterium 63-13]
MHKRAKASSGTRLLSKIVLISNRNGVIPRDVIAIAPMAHVGKQGRQSVRVEELIGLLAHAHLMGFKDNLDTRRALFVGEILGLRRAILNRYGIAGMDWGVHVRAS